MAAYTGSQLNNVSEVSSGMKPVASAGAAISAMASGVQPSARWMIAHGTRGTEQIDLVHPCPEHLSGDALRRVGA